MNLSGIDSESWIQDPSFGFSRLTYVYGQLCSRIYLLTNVRKVKGIELMDETGREREKRDDLN
jgi:hypothetical protein